MDAAKPHVVCIPCPYQSHITVMMNLAKLLHYKGFYITFVNTEFNHMRLLRSRGPNSLNGFPGFRFESIPDGLPSSDPDASQDIPLVAEAIKNNLLAPFLHLITTKFNNHPSTTNTSPPPTCFLTDFFMPITYQAGEEHGIPVIALSTVSATALLAFHRYQALLEKGFSPVKGGNHELAASYLHQHSLVELVPGMKYLRLKDLLGFEDPSKFDFIMECLERDSTRASTLIINTVENLEQYELEGLASIYRQVYAIGPIHLILKQIPNESPTNNIGSNLWNEESECLTWLDSKEQGSVVYVNFGSIAVMTCDQITEVAQGLAECDHNFLWVIRQDLLRSFILPADFVDQTKGRCFIGSWCPQEEVLNHASIGAFLTHNGWNSTLESVSSGVPMICKPFFGDQQINCRYVYAVWNVGIETMSSIGREDVIKAVKKVMEGEEGIRMKDRAAVLKKVVHEAVDPSGSSTVNLDILLKKMNMKLQME